jgi:uncharacterized protein
MNFQTKYQKAKMKLIQMKKVVRIFVLALLIIPLFGLSQTIGIPEKPSFIAPIIDSTKTLSQSELQLLYDKLKVYSDSTSTEVLVMIINTTHGQEIQRYATDLGQQWKIGKKGKDNGIIFLVAKADRKLTIQAGYGTEHLLTDALSRRIIEQVVKPEFKNGSFYNGIDNGITAIFQVMSGEYKNDFQKKEGIPIWVIIIFVILILFILSKIKGGPGNVISGGSPSLLDVIILSNMGRDGGGGFGNRSTGDSGFGGFGGGGSFGGGGASGSW